MAGNSRAIPFNRIQVEARNQETNKHSKREWFLQVRGSTLHHIVPTPCNPQSAAHQGLRRPPLRFPVEDDEQNSGRVARIHRGACQHGREEEPHPICS